MIPEPDFTYAAIKAATGAKAKRIARINERPYLTCCLKTGKVTVTVPKPTKAHLKTARSLLK